MHSLLMNFGAIFVIALIGFLLLKNPKGKKFTINALCERDYALLHMRVLRCQPGQAMGVEEAIDDFYNEFAGRAIKGLEYANELYSLLAQTQCSHG